MDSNASAYLSVHDVDHEAEPEGSRVLLIGEVLWDRFPGVERLGGAPLNLAVHLARLGHRPLLVSGVGRDAAGRTAIAEIAALGLDTAFVQTTAAFATGSAEVHLGDGEQTSFTIRRPAAYDAVTLTEADLQHLAAWDASWICCGTLFPSSASGRTALTRLLDNAPRATRFYDVNLRPGADSPALVDELLRRADVVKLNEGELQFVHEHFDLPADPEAFCRAGAERYGWRAACVTFGARGCVLLAGGECVQAPGVQVDVVDPVGAGDAFAAMVIHGLSSNWPAGRIAAEANRLGALVASCRGAIPAWSPGEVAGR